MRPMVGDRVWRPLGPHDEAVRVGGIRGHGGRAGGAGPGGGAAVGRGRAGENDRSRRPATSAADARWRSLDKTGNVRLLSAEDLALEFPDQVTPPPPGPPASEPTVSPAPA